MFQTLTTPRFWRDFDWFLLLVAIVLSSIGLIEIYSSTMSMSSENFFLRQLAWLGVGIVLMILVASVDYRILIENAIVIYGCALVVLAGVLLFGEAFSGARSWFRIGSVGFQPSELTKLIVAVVLARYFASSEKRFLSMWQTAAAALIVAVPVLLVALQPDLGTAMTFVPILAFGLFVRGIRPAVLVSSLLVVALLLPLGWFALEEYQKDRIRTFVEPEADPLGSGYQVIQSKIAIGSGGFWGTGLFEGSQNQLGFLPTRHTDFIFSVVAEELGFVGVTVTLLLLLTLVWHCLSQATAARDKAGMFLVLGIVGLFVGHIVVNVGMVIGLVPSTGIPLPFLSYGGSSLMTAFIGLGLIASVRRCRYVN
jgi:rod shape determining protein RodA